MASMTQTIDVLIGGYLSSEAAHEDYDVGPRTAARSSAGAVVVSKDLEGNVCGRADRPRGREGRGRRSARVGFVVGLFAPPLLAATAIGAAIGAGGGKALHRQDRQRDRGVGRRDDPDRRRRA